MVEPSGHCPYLGLKQNRAIRFASPTPEHRCYVTGEPQDIPVDQANYCLAEGHVHCPLYMGLGLPTTNAPVLVAPVELPRKGLLAWFGALSLRDRLIYGALVALLAVIVGIYAIAGAQLLAGGPTDPLPTPPSASPAASAPALVGSATPTLSPKPTQLLSPTPSPTDLPTPAKTPVPTPEPTITLILPPSPVIPPPTDTQPVNWSPTPSPAPPTIPLPPTFIPPPPPTDAPPTDTPLVDTETPPPPLATETATPEPSPTDTPVPLPPSTDTPVPPPPTTEPPPPGTPIGSPPAEPSPAESPSIPFGLTLYFVDEATGTLFISVRRTVRVSEERLAEAIVAEQLRGPRSGGLAAPVAGDTQLLGVARAGDTLLVYLDRVPGDDRALSAIALALTELRGVARVQLVAGGVPIGLDGGNLPIGRPLVNADNPEGRAHSYSSGSRFLPLYFRYGSYWARVTRLVGRTSEVARATLDALLEGPGSYGDLLVSPIPAAVQLLGITVQAEHATVNLSAPFAEAADRRAAVDALVLSLTELRSANGTRLINSVALQVEGRSLGEWWGAEWGRAFQRPAVNPE